MIVHGEREPGAPAREQFCQAPRLGDSSPWGTIDHVWDVAEGIVRVSTPGHGGYWLWPARMIQLRQQFPLFKPFAGEPWFEEDMDWCVVVLAFPEHFSEHSIWAAFDTFKRSASYSERMAAQQGWLDTDSARKCFRIAKQYEDAHADHWMCGSMIGGGSTDRLWSVHMTRLRDGAKKWVRMPYPEKPFYTDEELSKFNELIPLQSMTNLCYASGPAL